MTAKAQAPAPVKKMYWGGITSKGLGLALGLLCLRRWNSPHPWARLDLYSGGFFGVAAIVTVAEALTFLRQGLRSVETAREAFGLSYDPGLLRWSALLSVAELAVILDYAHWHLAPALERPALQALGLALLIASAVWLARTDTWLARHFSSEQAAARLMTQGPYRFVRHPRYAAFLFRQAGSSASLRQHHRLGTRARLGRSARPEDSARGSPRPQTLRRRLRRLCPPHRALAPRPFLAPRPAGQSA